MKILEYRKKNIALIQYGAPYRVRKKTERTGDGSDDVGIQEEKHSAHSIRD